MCGICGIYNFDKRKVERSDLKLMNESMIRRGPDSEGYCIENNFGMAMRRLSIIDIDKSNQPINSQDKNISVIFNGEIYNFIEIRDELIKDKIEFKTKGDTEVILKLYEKLGEKFVSKLIGMYSICIFDKNKNKVLIFRDRFGIKPLYYHHAKDSFYFSSSLFSFKKVLNLNKSKDSFLLYLCFNYFPSNTSAYENINSLLPGEYIRIENNNLSIQKYEMADSDNIYKSSNYNQSMLKDILQDSISINLRSDVNLGLMMSSGMDSSIIAKEVSKNTKDIKAYTVDFENKNENESQIARKFADQLNIDHETIEIEEFYVSDYLKEISKFMDEPCADTAIIPSYLISKKANEDGVKVLLSGAGGDEIFAGYGRHYLNFFSFFYGILNFLKIREHKLLKIFPHRIQNILFKSLDKKFAYIGNSSGQNLGVILDAVNKNFHEKLLDSLERILSNFVKNDFGFNSKQIVKTDLSLYLPDNILRPFDKVSMINSVEGRVPFLDHRLLEVIKTFDLDITKNGSFKNNKKILREIYNDDLPNYILNNNKKGFNAPIEKWDIKFDKHQTQEFFEDTLNMKLVSENTDNKNFKSFLYNLNTYKMWAENN